MTYYSQRDRRWINEKLGFSNSTIGGYGCTITCIGNLLDKTPLEVNRDLKINNGFSGKNRNLVNWEVVARIYGLEWRGWEVVPSGYPAITEVTGLPGYHQHFVIKMAAHNNLVIDPWTLTEAPERIDRRYRIKAYRGLYQKQSIPKPPNYMTRIKSENLIAREFHTIFGSCPRTQYLEFEATKLRNGQVTIDQLKAIWRGNIRGYQKHIFNAVQYIRNYKDLQDVFVKNRAIDIAVEQEYEGICSHYIHHRAEDSRTDRVIR